MPKPDKKLKLFRPDFGKLLRHLLEERELGVREFARMIGDFDPGYLAGVLAASRPPPIAHFPGWADALDLPHGEAREEFLRLGYLTHCPEQVWKMVDQLREENEKLRKRLEQ